MSGARNLKSRSTDRIATAVGTWSAEIRRDDDAFASLAGEWNELYSRCSTATPFQSYAWLESWWREYGVPGRLRLALVRMEGRLVAAAPLMVQRRGPWLVLSPLGLGLSDFTEILLDDRWAAEASRVLSSALLAEPGWQVGDFREARPGGTARHLFDEWPGTRWRVGGSVCFEVPAGSVDELLGSLPRQTSRRIRGRLRKIDKLGLAVRRVGVAEVEEAVAGLIRLHERQWRGRRGNVEHLRPRFARHLVRAASGMVEQGQAEIFEYRIGGRVVAVDLAVVGPDFVGTYLPGVDPSLRNQVDVPTMLLLPVFELAEQRGRATVSLLRGDEPYKTRWHPVRVRNERLLVGRAGRSPAVAAYATAVRARTAAADALRYRLPWLREARRNARQASARLLFWRGR